MAIITTNIVPNSLGNITFLLFALPYSFTLSAIQIFQGVPKPKITYCVLISLSELLARQLPNNTLNLQHQKHA